MRHPRRLAALVTVALLAVSALSTPAQAQAAPAVPTATTIAAAQPKAAPDVPPPAQTSAGADYAHQCPVRPDPGHYTCFSLRRTNPQAQVTPQSISGFGPADLQSAYALPSGSAGAGQTVYVIDAFGYPNAEADLQMYRNHYGLPTCTTGNGCFKKVNQTGSPSPLPKFNDGWAGETALDLDMVSAVCPLCHITLVESNDDTNNLFVAVQWANSQSARYISMSWGGPEDGTEASYDSVYFSKTGVVYSASSGDGGYAAGVIYPATSKNVVSVGGTSLRTDASPRGWSESTWGTDPSDGTGSGCSGDEPKQVWQSIVATSVCPRRTSNDVSAVADPYTGVAVYQQGSIYGDWSVAGGTSASAPIIAATYALAGPIVQTGAYQHPVAYPYANAGALNDVTDGTNGTCTPSLLCTAATGWDGPTGLGTPNGVAAFTKPAETINVTNPGDQLSSVGNAVSLPITASDSVSGQTLTYSAPALPAGLSISPSTGTVTGTPTAAGVTSVTLTAANTSTSVKTSVTFTWTVRVAGSFVSVDASRLLDTRKGLGAPLAPVPTNGSIAFQVLGRGGLPTSGVSAVVLNVTVTAPIGPGYVTAFADGSTRPPTSNLDYDKGQTVPNLVVVPVGADGKVRLYASATTHLIADVSGFYVSGAPVASGTFGRLVPARLLDTRKAIGAPKAKVANNGTIKLAVAGKGGVPATGVSAVILNVTATGSKTTGYVTVYPSAPKPVASNLDFPAAKTVPNLVVVPVASDGSVRLTVSGGGGTDLIADVFGYFKTQPPSTPTASGSFRALSPARILDSRNGTGDVIGPLANGDTITLQVSGRGGVTTMPHVSAVVLNVLVTNPTGPGYITVYNADQTQPYTSNLDYAKGQTIANLVMVPVGVDGQVSLTVVGAGTTQLIADVSGYYLSGN